MKLYLTIKCERCGTKFTPRVKTQRFCSPKCQAVKYGEDNQFESPSLAFGVPRHLVGAIGEYAVALDLMRKGWFVYRQVCNQSPVDLMAYKSGSQVLRVEVKTGYKRGGRLYYPPPKEGQSDILAIATVDDITYVPELPGD